MMLPAFVAMHSPFLVMLYRFVTTLHPFVAMFPVFVAMHCASVGHRYPQRATLPPRAEQRDALAAIPKELLAARRVLGATPGAFAATPSPEARRQERHHSPPPLSTATYRR